MTSPACLLFTGSPRSGKTTVVAATCHLLRDAGARLAGFYTQQVLNADGQRVGFDLVDVASERRRPLARRGWHDATAQVGSYGVDVTAVSHMLPNGSFDIAVMDEIGRMQLLDQTFVTAVDDLIGTHQVLGTIHVFDHPVTSTIRARQDVTVRDVDATPVPVLADSAVSWLLGPRP